MKSSIPWRRRWLAAGALAVALTALAVRARADGIAWHAREGQVDADISGWAVSRILEAVAGDTGWHVYLEPGAEETVSTRFERLRPPEALRRLLGGLNFALLPQTNGPAKLFVFRTSVQDATQRIERRPEVANAAGKPIGNELVVRLKPGAKETIEQLAARLGAKVVGRLEELSAYRLRFEDDASALKARADLETSADVAAVESNFPVAPPSRLDPLTFSSVPPLMLKPNVSPSADHLVIALIDTPVAAVQASLKDFLLPAVSVAGTADPAASAQLTHGTAMAETILRALSQTPQDPKGTSVRILPVDVYGSGAATTTFEVAQGLYAALPAGPSIVNLSLGSSGESPLLHEVIQAIAKQGPIIVAAAGNEPTVLPVYPAAYPEVLAVTAGDRQGNIAPYANRGDFVDLVGPGTSLVRFNDQAYLGTGTSYSAAWVSGTVAGLAASTSKTPAEVVPTLGQQSGASVRPKP